MKDKILELLLSKDIEVRKLGLSYLDLSNTDNIKFSSLVINNKTNWSTRTVVDPCVGAITSKFIIDDLLDDDSMLIMIMTSNSNSDIRKYYTALIKKFVEVYERKDI